MKLGLILIIVVLLIGCVKNGPANPNYRRDERPDRQDRPIHALPSR